MIAWVESTSRGVHVIVMVRKYEKKPLAGLTKAGVYELTFDSISEYLFSFVKSERF